MEVAKIRVEVNEEKEQRVENTNKGKSCSFKKKSIQLINFTLDES